MTVNPDAGQFAPNILRDEGLYPSRFDLNGDTWEQLSFKARFGAVVHADDHDRTHVQSLRFGARSVRPHCPARMETRL
jgi:hypothetical protein